MEAAHALRSVPDDVHVAVDLSDRSAQMCRLAGTHVVVALPPDDVLTCTNSVPLRRRPAMAFSPMCKAQLVLDEAGQPPARCPRCGSVFTV